MRRTILGLGAAAALACLSAAPASAQYLPDLNFPDAPLSLWQEEVVARIREEDRNLFSHVTAAAGLYRKPFSEWIQSDLAEFREEYDEYLQNRLSLLSPQFQYYASALFFEQVFENTEGGDGGEGEGGEGE